MIITNKQFPNYKKYEMMFEGRPLSFEVAAKTGTVGTQKGNTDAYALSYTTKDCAAVWLGNADNSKIHCTGSGKPCSLLYEINQSLEDIYKAKQVSIDAFKAPKGIVCVDLDKSAYYDTHTLLLADDNAPAAYRISELFKTSAIPLNKSTSFTNPSIFTPTISVQNNCVCIIFDKRCPRYYTYKIERRDYTSHTTLYTGEFLPEFIDDTLIAGNVYAYTVTPIFEGIKGTPILLPSVSFEVGEKAEIGHDKILSKDWWKN
jgi:membrane carboxypeptidase/penicillin-binding protein PbpC